MTDFHENLAHHDRHGAEIGSERSFGIVFGGVFLVLGLYPLLRGASPALWLLGLSAAMFVVAFAAPGLLRHPNRWWFRFGLLLAAIVSPVAISVVYFLTVVPVGLLMRAFGKDPLALRFDRDARSYWVERRPPGPKPETLRNQF